MADASAAAFADAVAEGLERPGRVAFETDVPLAPLTTWGIGGPAGRLVRPSTPFELGSAVAEAGRAGEPVTILGRGSNVLIADAGVPGVVVCLRTSLGGIERVPGEEATYRVQAGCPMPKVAVTAGKDGVAGLEFLVGIPGSLGAGVAINAGIGGADGTGLDTVLVDALLLDPRTGALERVAAADLELGYRRSNVPARGAWVLEATVRGRSGDPAAVRERQREIQRVRAAKQPLQRKTSGSVFKQPEGGRPAGWYIDRAGLKGHAVGDARVSPQHANWIENHGAGAEDVKALMELVRARVEREFGIVLEREVRFLPEDARS